MRKNTGDQGKHYHRSQTSGFRSLSVAVLVSFLMLGNISQVKSHISSSSKWQGNPR